MKRLILSACLFFTFHLPVAYANKGVAFVHGTGTVEDGVAYWGREFVDTVRSALPNRNNYVAVACDFNKYMWDRGASGCLADYLYNFIREKRITKMTVILHSNGGNVMRWIMSNPTLDARHPVIIDAIEEIYAHAPSSAGTPLADASIEGNVFEQALGWLLDRKHDAVRQQQVAYMAAYNRVLLNGTAGRPSLPKPFKVIVGTGVTSNIFSGAARCGGLVENLGLLVTKQWLERCSDGFIGCSSQLAAGAEWREDVSATQRGQYLNHQQSRRDCFGLGTVLKRAIRQ